MACTVCYDIIIWTDPSASTTVADFPCPWFLENMSIPDVTGVYVSV